MDKASIIEIQGVKWQIEDENATKKINELETEIQKLKTIEKWAYTIPTYGGTIIARRQGNVVSVSGTGIGKVKALTPDIGDINFAILPERFRPSEEQFFIMRLTGTYQTQYGGMVLPDGNINYYTYTVADYACFSVSYIVD